MLFHIIHTDILVYFCDVNSTNGSTVWKGSAFDQCMTSEITLLHSRRNFANETSTTCNDYDIVATFSNANDSSVVSQVIFTVTTDSNIIGRIVSCYYDDGILETLINSYTVNYISSSKCNFMIIIL